MRKRAENPGPSGAHLAIGLLLAVAATALFARGLEHDFVSLDDRTYVTENRIVQEGLTASGIAWAFGLWG